MGTDVPVGVATVETSSVIDGSCPIIHLNKAIFTRLCRRHMEVLPYNPSLKFKSRLNNYIHDNF